MTGALGLVLALLAGCGKPDAPRAAPLTVAQAVAQTSVSCQECHQDIFLAWQGTDHALANRPVDPTRDAAALAAFKPTPGVGPGSQPEFVLGHRPLWQPLIATEGGRWQPHELAFDPTKREWFNVFGGEERQPGEWGHWTGRGMNWNSMCAQCHMTGYRKNYDAGSDTYRSSWVEHGVGCIQCHGPTAPGHGRKEVKPTEPIAPFFGERQKIMQTCAPCHARNEQLTLDFQPGDAYADHYRLALPLEQGVFYPDGQQRDEDFTWTSVQLSRMGHAGVTCMDCHDPHTTKTLLPVTNNQLCLQCHAAPGRVQPGGARAVPIDPVAHSRHADETAGNSCVACHMPTTTYMQRAPRHDHGWLKPDPLLTKELGIPNACSRCHEDKPIEWLIGKTDEWYGAKMDSRQRARARAVAAAQANDARAEAGLLALLREEDIPAWRATYLGFLAARADDPTVQQAAQKSLGAADPLERAAAVRVVAGSPDAARLLTPLLKDPVRLVRLDAAWELSPTLPADSPRRRELDAFHTISLDQPVGLLRLGQDLANRGQLVAAEAEVARAAAWDPNSPGILEVQGMVLAGLGRTAEAAGKLFRAAQLLPQGALTAMHAGLAYAEAGMPREAENSFRFAVQCDPRLDRAWYNLGLLLVQAGRAAESADALRQAATLAPTVADYPYALATVLVGMGDKTGARVAAQRALQLNPAHQGAQQVMRHLNQ
jgi:predicted CXXCH cytochrome family protein